MYKKYSFRAIKSSFIFLLFFSLACRSDRNKDKLEIVIPICSERLFVEKFNVRGGGALGGDMISAYLTDSANFRIYLRTYDNAHETIAFECVGKDGINIYRQKEDPKINKFRNIDTTYFSRAALKKNKVFE